MPELPLLSYADIIGMNYIPASAGIVLSAAEQTLACQAVAIFGFSEMWSDYDLYADEIEALMASTLDALLDTAIPPPEVGMDSEITLFPGNMIVSAGNPIVNSVNTSARGNYVSQQSPNINGNTRQVYRYMAAGDWTMRLTAVTQPTGCSLGITIVDADGTLHILTAANLRTAGTVFNTVFERTFTLNQSGKTLIFFAVNAGSTGGFGDLLQLLEMWRTDEP